MARINLLPWRAERRKQRQKEFSILLAMSALGAILLSFLMVGYYKALQEGQGRSEALRSVQLKMLRSRDRQHPYYWAAFIESGEWANLDGKR